MIPVAHASNNDVLQPPRGTTHDQVQPLPITRVRFSDNTPAVWSYWQPSDDERWAIATGAAVRLSIVGHTHPPLHIGVDEDHQADNLSVPSVEHVMQLVAKYRAIRSNSPMPEQEAYRAVLDAVCLLFARGTSPPTPAARDVLLERVRQISAEGWTPEHDDHHGKGEMAAAAGCYALFTDAYPNQGQCPAEWPWNADWWKPTNYRRDLEKAGALILAEIERLDRLTKRTEGA
ncbi:MAG: hypothetical protein ACT6UH_00525 [Hydrogenophaga sp.]|uniref:hypothetical protein n=1 Tax=Hydrogenophaga sp. TaxID=1904254 RepID=UPI0040369CDF